MQYCRMNVSYFYCHGIMIIFGNYFVHLPGGCLKPLTVISNKSYTSLNLNKNDPTIIRDYILQGLKSSIFLHDNYCTCQSWLEDLWSLLLYIVPYTNHNCSSLIIILMCLGNWICKCSGDVYIASGGRQVMQALLYLSHCKDKEKGSQSVISMDYWAHLGKVSTRTGIIFVLSVY